MSGAVVGASAILAVVREEPGNEAIHPYLKGALVSAVGWAEVVGRLLETGAQEPEIRAIPGRFKLEIVPFDPEDAWETGRLRRRTRWEGLSLADRACLGLAISRGLPAVTTDRAWGRLGLGPAVKVVGR